MRFKGTLVLLILCAGLGVFLYFYEIKGEQQRTQRKMDENLIWKVPGEDIQQLDLITPAQHITAVRTGDRLWKITSPRPVDADSEEVNRLVTSAAELRRESIVEENAASLAPFGLDPAQTTVTIKMKDGSTHEIRFGSNNPSGNSSYAALPGKNRVFMVASFTASTFTKKLDDLRSRVILGFEQSETQSLELKNSKGALALAKENDRWWTQGKDRWAIDSSMVSSLLGDLSSGRLKEFFDENPDDYANLGLDKPLVDLRLTVGKDKAIKHLTIGLEKSELTKKGQAKAKPEGKPGEKPAEKSGGTLYIARDDSRSSLFFVDKEFVDKFLKSPADFRDKKLAILARWDVDAITVTNAKGTVTLAKAEGGSDWVVGPGKKKAKWDAVNEIFDALEKPVKEFIDIPGPLSKYGLDKPVAQVVLKQGASVKLDCIFGKEDKEGVFAQVQGEPYIKIVDKDCLAKLGKAESDYLEPEPAPAQAPPAPKK